MKRKWMAIGFVVVLGIGARSCCSPTPGPDPILPCGACTYTNGNHKLEGVLNSAANPPTPYPYPISGMTVKLFRGSTLLDTLTNLSPSSGSGDTRIDQTLQTNAANVDSARFEYRNANNVFCSEPLTVR